MSCSVVSDVVFLNRENPIPFGPRNRLLQTLRNVNESMVFHALLEHCPNDGLCRNRLMGFFRDKPSREDAWVAVLDELLDVSGISAVQIVRSLVSMSSVDLAELRSDSYFSAALTK